jgi:hypothetical protein
LKLHLSHLPHLTSAIPLCAGCRREWLTTSRLWVRAIMNLHKVLETGAAELSITGNASIVFVKVVWAKDRCRCTSRVDFIFFTPVQTSISCQVFLIIKFHACCLVSNVWWFFFSASIANVILATLLEECSWAIYFLSWCWWLTSSFLS